jgi:hypothetical protein
MRNSWNAQSVVNTTDAVYLAKQARVWWREGKKATNDADRHYCARWVMHCLIKAAVVRNGR